MTKIIKFNLFVVTTLLFLLSCKQTVGRVIDTLTIKAGTAKITGRITSLNDKITSKTFVNITVLHPISGEYVQYKAFVDQSGRFSLDVDVETTITLIGIYTNLNPEKSILVKLTNGGVTNIDITYNSGNNIENIHVTPNMPQNDMTEGLNVMGKIIEYVPDRAPVPLYNKSVDYFLNHAKNVLSERLEILNNDTLLSKELKKVLSKDFHLFLYNTHVFDYEAQMMLNYKNTGADQNKKPDIHKIDRSYFRFLKDFNFNDTQYLQCFTFPEIQKTILQNEILGLPLIGENDIPSWLANVKVILSDLVGFNDGPYYDILVANAYSRQLNEEVKPLTEKQKENIINYWKNGEIAKILFRKNLQVVELNKSKSPVVVNNISSTPNAKVMEAILSKYKGKVVLVDFWATWCTPCLDAMQQFRSTKSDYHNKNIVFVYLTNSSSPRKLWEEKIQGIGSEHYYLKGSQWEYIMNHFEFEYIPSYLLYNKDGKLINKFSAFPGNEELKEMINGLLEN